MVWSIVISIYWKMCRVSERMVISGWKFGFFYKSWWKLICKFKWKIYCLFIRM